jgi:hypothetical protein
VRKVERAVVVEAVETDKEIDKEIDEDKEEGEDNNELEIEINEAEQATEAAPDQGTAGARLERLSRL